MRLSLVEHDGRALPVLFMRYAETNFRAKITSDTPASILIDIVSVFPLPLPLAYVMPVIFDDPKDPYWSFLTLTLFPIATVRGVPCLYDESEDLWYSRKLMRACANRGSCGLVVLNERHEVLKSEIALLEDWDLLRPKEISEVLDLLDSRDNVVDYSMQAEATKILCEIACFLMKDPNGKYIYLPRDRWPHIAERRIFPLKLSSKRLIERKAIESTAETWQFDVFISHAHAESSFAVGVSDWLRATWPKLKIFHTRPENRQELLRNPQYFIDAAKASKLIVLLATPVSVGRPIIEMEIALRGNNVLIPVLSSGVTLSDWKTYADDQLFIDLQSIDPVDLGTSHGWSDFASLVAKHCELGVPQVLPPTPAIREAPVQQAPEEVSAGYVQYWESCLRSIRMQQSVDEASQLLDAWVDHLSGNVIPSRAVPLIRSFDPFSKLVVFLMHWDDEMAWRGILSRLPALLTEKLLNAANMQLSAQDFGEREAEHRRLQRIKSCIVAAIDQEAQ